MRMRRGLIASVVAVAVLASAGADSARAQSFYEGKTVRIIVGLAAGGGFDTYARVLARHWGKHIPGNPTIIVENMVGAGYKGTSEIRLAATGGELAGACWSWESMRAAWRNALDAGEVVPIVQVTAKPFPDLPNVPLAVNLAKNDEARRLIQVAVQNVSAYARPFVLPPATPKERVQLLRKAFQETLKDPAFLAEVEKTKLTLDPVTGDELEKLVADAFTIEPALSAKLKAILYN